MLVDRIAVSPERLDEFQPMLVQTLAVLAPLLDVHLELEERIVFPALRQLEPDARTEIVAAMRARRKS
jgi:hypothetical protein